MGLEITSLVFGIIGAILSGISIFLTFKIRKTTAEIEKEVSKKYDNYTFATHKADFVKRINRIIDKIKNDSFVNGDICDVISLVSEINCYEELHLNKTIEGLLRDIDKKDDDELKSTISITLSKILGRINADVIS